MRIEAIKNNQHYEVPELDNLNINKDRITLYFDYEGYLQEEKPLKGATPKAQPGSLQATLSKILGKNAKVRRNVSVGEGRRIYMDAIWEKYGQ